MKTNVVTAVADRGRGANDPESPEPGPTALATNRAVELLRQGEVVALPTETVYGLAADALNASAVAKIFEAKERPRFDPLIVHLPGNAWLERVVEPPPEDRELVLNLAANFWPGPFTMVLPKRESIPDIVTAGLTTVAIRISSHRVFSEIVSAFGKPLAAPSANRFGRVSPTTAQHVLDELYGRIPLIVDGGPTEYGIESTVVSVRPGKIAVLRRGPITAEQLAKFAPTEIAVQSEKISAPGQLASHYAPKTPVQLVDDANLFSPPPNKRCALLAWKTATTANLTVSDELDRRSAAFAQLRRAKGDHPSLRFTAVRYLSESEDLREAAANLFRYLRELDQLGVDLIVAERVPDQGLGSAILDRLERASHRASDGPNRPG
jgi:L-threonylcarbamoyladenylate synthase